MNDDKGETLAELVRKHPIAILLFIAGLSLATGFLGGVLLMFLKYWPNRVA